MHRTTLVLFAPLAGQTTQSQLGVFNGTAIIDLDTMAQTHGLSASQVFALFATHMPLKRDMCVTTADLAAAQDALDKGYPVYVVRPNDRVILKNACCDVLPDKHVELTHAVDVFALQNQQRISGMCSGLHEVPGVRCWPFALLGELRRLAQNGG